MILLVHSARDIAGVNIAESILQNYPFTKTTRTYQENPVYTAEINGKQVSFLTLKEEAVNAQYLPEDFPSAELVVFTSRHSSLSGRPTLSVHTTGNFAVAGLGGLPRTLSVAPAMAMQTALKALHRLKQELTLDYEVSYECTHHGPSLNVPVMFVELGSSEPQWRDSKAAQAVGDATMSAIANFSPKGGSAVLGIGGPHYNQKFTRLALNDGFLFGHMVPKYAVSTLDSAMISQCVEKTLEKVSSAVLDWKGISSQDKPKLLSALQDVKLPFKKV
ncbi:MAG TPA: D-aminoacyl-tRNA deacylase [Candidatus Limnocylindrales bacterium]|nr:D-aminoacyl-tRNA deacylase [Candidatus Limnocylindrales bacterium]